MKIFGWNMKQMTYTDIQMMKRGMIFFGIIKI